MKYILAFIVSCGFSQNQSSNYRTLKVAVNDSILIDGVSINSSWFSLKKTRTIIDSTFYTIDFSKVFLTFKNPLKQTQLLLII